MRRVAIIGVALAAGALAPAAQAHVQRASADGVSATFSYQGSYPSYRDERLTITRDGHVAYLAPVRSAYCPRQFPCGPFTPSPGGSAVHVARLSAGGAPAVVLGLYTGGAHCCAVAQVYLYEPATGGYRRIEHDFGDPGFRLTDLRHDGVQEFQSADDSFAYAFTDYAASGLPLQVLAVRGGRFADVTRAYPRLIAADAALWLHAFRSQAPGYSDTTGVIAAWAADEDELGHSALVARFLDAQARAGHLRSPLYPKRDGRRFIAVLDRFLRQHGYLR